MLEAVANVVKAALLPGSASFLLLGLTACLLLLLLGRLRRTAWAGLILLTILYWMLSLPAVAGFLANGLRAEEPPLLSAKEAAGCDAIIVLGTGVASFGLHGSEIGRAHV